MIDYLHQLGILHDHFKLCERSERYIKLASFGWAESATFNSKQYISQIQSFKMAHTIDEMKMNTEKLQVSCEVQENWQLPQLGVCRLNKQMENV